MNARVAAPAPIRSNGDRTPSVLTVPTPIVRSETRISGEIMDNSAIRTEPTSTSTRSARLTTQENKHD
ncbi:unnamed protein product [Angiostrongylus costaricensis]|uniref:Uncharacterized protein n=1 Tax=Angiostrongylus costaricensis TaxID=334426 RepID=A0A0R3PIX3_ANGCS|nr:unnamed protein product [Angiostrongylus costaricensis]